MRLYCQDDVEVDRHYSVNHETGMLRIAHSVAVHGWRHAPKQPSHKVQFDSNYRVVTAHVFEHQERPARLQDTEKLLKLLERAQRHCITSKP